MGKKIKGITLEQEFACLNDLVSKILEKSTEARNSDTKLYFLCLRELGATTLEEAESLNLNTASIDRCRRYLQNKEGKFLPDKEILEVREEREEQHRELFRGNNVEHP